MLTFARLTEASVTRCSRWHRNGLADWSPERWLVATIGEFGEAANALKKWFRIVDGIANKNEPGRDLTYEYDAIEKVGEELADTFIYLDLFVARLGVSALTRLQTCALIDLDADKSPPISFASLSSYNRLMKPDALKPEDPLVDALSSLGLMADALPTIEMLSGSKNRISILAAQTFIRLDSVAVMLGISSTEAVIRKFNATSLKYNFPERL